MAKNTSYLTCTVGDRVKLIHPLGHPPTEFSGDKPETQYLKGFIILKPELGEFEGYDDKGYVYYRHKHSGRQIIKYVSEGLGSFEFYLVVEGIVVHDHASVAMGGPAFATYYSEHRQEEG
ncbi:MAG: hypothetical protein DRH15_04200 [Deltaproteobacteria bacterium]|nr:MAG: hypothetical protein DRH15_04200 [Deltaproteobacteria bacterium]